MMDRNREARRAAAMAANGVQRRRHRTTSNPGSLRDSPEEEGSMELQEAARFRDRTVRKERDRDRDRERGREKERERLNRSKRRRNDKYIHGGNSVREDGGGGGGVGVSGGGIDDSSEESVNDDEDDDDDGPVGFVPQSNPVSVSTSTSPVTNSSPLTSQRRSYPPPNKVYRVTPSWKAPDEMIGVSVPRKARSASTKRSHECWTSSGVAGESSSSPAPTTTTPTIPTVTAAQPMSPSSSNVSMKKKIKQNGGIKHRPPKPLTSKTSPSSFQDEIEIEVAEVLYGLMRQSQPPSSSSSKVEPTTKLESRSSEDSKSGVLSHVLPNQNSRSSTPLTVVAPKRKKPRLYPDENPRNNQVSTKAEIDQPQKIESQSPIREKMEGSMPENVGPISEPTPMINNGVVLEKMVEEMNGGRNSNMIVRSTTKVEEVSSSSPKLESCQNHDRLDKTNSNHVEKENRRGDKFEIDLMAPASPEKEEEMGEYTGKREEDEKSMVMDRETETKSKQNEVQDHKSVNGSVPEFNVATDDSKVACGPDFTTKPVSLSFPPLQHQQSIVSNPNGKDKEKEKESNFGLQLDLEKGGMSNNESKVNFQQQKLQQLKISSRDDSHLDNKIGGQSTSMALPMSVPAGWHGGLTPMGYMGPLQGVVSMDGTTMASPPIQPPPPPPFIFSQPKPKRCATHCYIARSISVHQQMMKMSPYWPPPGAVAGPPFGPKSYNLNMVPSADLHSGRGGSAQESRGQPYAFFPPPALTTKDNASQAAAPSLDSAQKKQFLLPPGLPPGAAGNMMQMQHAPPALFFPMGQQQAAGSVRPGTGKNPSMPTGASSTSTFTSTPMAATMSNASPAGPAMSFSYPNINGNEAQFMAILGNGPYPFIPGHVGATPPYRGSHPQAMPFFNGSFYSSQMLHPSQLQPPPQSGGQNHQNASMSTTGSSSSQKHLQTQQSRAQGSGANVGNPNQNQNPNLQNFQATKCRETGGGEDSPSTADSRNRPNMSVYGQNFVMPFNSPNFALMPSSLGSGGVPNGIHGDKKQQSQQAALSSPFAMSFTTINGGTTPGLDMSSMAHNHAYLQSLPEAAKQNYQMMAAAQAAQQGKTKYHGSEDGKKGVGTSTDPSNLDEERRAMAARVSAASSGQSIAFSRDMAENTVVDSSARSLNLGPGSGSTRPARSSGPHAVNNSPNSQQQSQMLFPKQQQQYTPPNSANARSKTPSTSSGNVYPDHLNSSTIMAAKFPSNLSAFPSIVQTSVGPTQSQWKNSVRPNTSQSPSPSNTTTSNMKNIPQQQGRSQGQSHTQISFGPSGTNSKQSAVSPGQQTQNSSQAPSSPMMVGSPSNSSISKSAGGSPRTSASNKSVGQGPTLSSQQGKNSTSQPTSAQKPSILGSSPQMMSTTGPTGKAQLQQPPHQQPQLSKQSIQQAQLYFSNYMQANPSAAMAGTGYYLQRHNRPDIQQQQQQQLQSLQHQQLQHSIQQQQMQGLQQGSKSQGSKSQGSIPPTSSSGMFNASQFASPGAPNQLIPASFPYVHAVSTAVPVKPTEQKQPAGE